MKHIFFSLMLLFTIKCSASDDWTLMQYHKGSTTYQFHFTPQETIEDTAMHRYVVAVTTLYDEIAPYSNGVEIKQCAVDLTVDDIAFLAQINSAEEIKAFVRHLGIVE